MARKYMQELHRVLKPGAKFVMLSLGSPDVRTEHLECAPWQSIDCKVIGKASAVDDEEQATVHHFYLCVKKKETTDDE